MIDLTKKYSDHFDIKFCYNCNMTQVNQYVITKKTSQDLVYKALAALTIEQALLKTGKLIYDKVASMLNEKYQCYIPDCYEHPEYLNDILRELFGNVNNVIPIEIIKEIRRELEEFSHKDQVTKFTEALIYQPKITMA